MHRIIGAVARVNECWPPEQKEMVPTERAPTGLKEPEERSFKSVSGPTLLKSIDLQCGQRVSNSPKARWIIVGRPLSLCASKVR